MSAFLIKKRQEIGQIEKIFYTTSLWLRTFQYTKYSLTFKKLAGFPDWGYSVLPFDFNLIHTMLLSLDPGLWWKYGVFSVGIQGTGIFHMRVLLRVRKE